MAFSSYISAAVVLATLHSAQATLPLLSGTRHVNMLRLQNELAVDVLAVDTSQAVTFPLFNFTQPLDHFVDTGHTFQQRFWVNDRHFQPGGPVIVFDGGEGSGTFRMPILDTGIVDILASATNGLGIVLEHRYYGASIPVQNFTTDSLRWLTIQQALADSANFMANVTIPGIQHNINAPNTPWIYYGGSYAGAQAAYMRVLYPDLVYGAISSSGVTFAQLSNWGYYDIVRQFSDADCIKQVETSILEIDNLFEESASAKQALKNLFGVPTLTHDGDFGWLLQDPLGEWAAQNWDPAISSKNFDAFCETMGKPSNATVEIAPELSVTQATINYATFINKTTSRCTSSNSDDCFGSFNPADFQQTDLSQTWRTWQFQVCTEFGWFFTAPPNAKQPRVVSKSLTLEYASMICKLAYPPGEHFAVPAEPDISSINAFGGFNISFDRLAIIDGQYDPWRFDTPHTDVAPSRPDTILRPFKLIPGGVHHYDENGLADHSAEPPQIQEIHRQIVEFVKAWLQDFKGPSSH